VGKRQEQDRRPLEASNMESSSSAWIAEPVALVFERMVPSIEKPACSWCWLLHGGVPADMQLS
jgi:hypothetical protein